MAETGTTCEVIVVGAGISGAATAYELATRGTSVVLLDRYGPAAMASGWSLAGVRQSGRDPAELPMAKAAVELWADLAARLDGETHYTRKGNLRLASTPEEVAIIQGMVADQAKDGLDLTFLPDLAAVRAVAPAIADHVLAASFCPTDGQADAAMTTRAFVAAAERAGAVTRFGERALEILTEGGRVTGLRTDRGVIQGPRLVLAAGIFGNELLEPFGRRVPLEIKRTTILQSPPGPTVLEQVIGTATASCAGRQEWDGRWRASASSPDIPWDGRFEDQPWPAVLPEAIDVWRVVERFGKLVPAFQHARIERSWIGLIDKTPDALPVIDAATGTDGLVVAFGFSGHGFCLGPITGRILAALALGEAPGFDLDAFRLARFDGWNGPAAELTLHG